MVPIILPQDIRTLDSWCSTVQGVEPWELMQRASENVASAIIREIEHRTELQNVLIVAGPGNNGGDGLCVASILRKRRPDMSITVLDARCGAQSSDLRSRAWMELEDGINVISPDDVLPSQSADIIVDSILGVGGSELLRDPLPSLLQALDHIQAFRIALDVPTGLNCENGNVHTNVFRSDVTITISAEKRGFWLGDGPSCVGRVVVVPVGVPNAEDELPRSVSRMTHDDRRTLLPPRPRVMSKFDAGRVLVIGGTVSMPGAASMTAEAALRAGAGLVHLAAPRIHTHTPREIIVHELPAHDDGTISSNAREQILELVLRADVVAVGPGLGTNPSTIAMLAKIVAEIDPRVPVVIDADGLLIVPQLAVLRPTIVLTPHRGEFSRLVGVDRQHLSSNPLELAQEWCERHTAVLHLKDVPSVTCHGNSCILTVNGTPRMSTAGSGDVLTGIIAGVLAQGVTVYEGTALAAYLHAEAGTLAAGGACDQPIIATDMLRTLQSAMTYSVSS